MARKAEGQVTCPECGKVMLRSTLKKHVRWALNQELEKLGFSSSCSSVFYGTDYRRLSEH
jgi:hypothetical protein